MASSVTEPQDQSGFPRFSTVPKTKHRAPRPLRACRARPRWWPHGRSYSTAPQIDNFDFFTSTGKLVPITKCWMLLISTSIVTSTLFVIVSAKSIRFLIVFPQLSQGSCLISIPNCVRHYECLWALFLNNHWSGADILVPVPNFTGHIWPIVYQNVYQIIPQLFNNIIIHSWSIVYQQLLAYCFPILPLTGITIY